MAAQVRSVDFLPEIFQTPVNRQFLNATLDQLIQEPQFKKTQGYVGRRVGPGVNATDRYVIEPTKSRNDYQLEPGVVEIDPTNSQRILDTITYPGITDALKLQGANTDKADRLYTSEYYAFDPFVDYDKFTNFSQYYWLPAGPLAVDVFATEIPLTDDITVTRENGVYTFSNTPGTNPVITLVRGGNYNFNVAQNKKETVNFRVTNNNIASYVIDYEPNPTLTLARGNTYVFNLSLDGVYPFYIKTLASLGNVNLYSTGVSRNGASTGSITFTVPQDAPDTLYYACSDQFNMRGQINIVNGTPGTGPGFWIQADPGVSGRLPYAPNISSRDVLGVINNGEDLGTVTFNVPYKDAQAFYYGLSWVNNQSTPYSVDLLTGLKFNQINNQFVSEFLANNPGGIDGITNLNGRTIVFQEQVPDPQDGGWQITTQFDPLIRDDALNGDPGSFDSVLFDQTTDVPPTQYYSVWRIEYQYDTDGNAYMVLSSIQPINNLQKFNILYGTQWASTSWYKNASGVFEEIPLLTAIRDVLYYQDGTDPEIFGQIRLIDPNDNATIFVESNADPVTLYGAYITGNQLFISEASGAIVPGMRLSGGNVTAETYIVGGSGTTWILNHIATGTPTTAEIVEILGSKNYTSPNGVVFTNGLKVTFRGSVEPASYQGQTYYVEGVGTAIKLLPVSNFVTPETYTQSATVPYDSTPFDVGNFDATLNAPVEQDYLTINRASLDLNPWTRSNRWFHIDVINASAAYNNTVAVVDNLQRGRRPILEFRAGTRLFDFGTEGIAPVDVIDFATTDALSTINGSTGYGVDGYNFINGSTVIFAADTDPDVRSQVYEVTFITPDSVAPLIAEPVINLVPVYASPVLLNQSTVCLSGNTLQGKSFYYDGVSWIAAQDKIKTNQAPLFDVYDADGISFSNRTKYPSSTFVGSKLFSYATPSTATATEIYSSLNDPVLGFQLVYLSLSNVGDIVFDNNLYKDTFVYAPDSVGTTVPVSSGFVREYTDRINYSTEIGWQTAVTKSRARQQFRFVYDGTPLLLDVRVDTNNVVPAIQLFVNSSFEESANYSYTTTDNTTTITLNKVYAPGDVVEVSVLSSQVSAQAFYQVPTNLENNPLNANSEQFTLGTIRSHYATICENLIELSGPINGANNTRDLGNIVPYGQQILQQSAPLTLAGYFMRSKEYDIFGALDYNSREYIKFKDKLMETVVNNDYGTMTVPQILDTAIADITLGRTNLNPFFYSDMLPTGSNYQVTNTTVTAITTSTFNLLQTYDFTYSNYLGLLVYIYPASNPGVPLLLERDVEYTVSTTGPRLTITVPLTVGDVVSIVEYSNTTGNFVPNTPTKLGLYPKWRPRIFLDENYVNPTPVIQGHDGSITVAFGDIRDAVLLEFEKRIYNNLKTDDNPIPLTVDEVIPGFFRTTDYTQTEITAILGESFLSWVGWNKLDYKAQDYNAADPFTYNYSAAGSKLNPTTDQVSNINEQKLLGAWRGIYRYFYDTTSPNYSPWEMLGFTEQPSWWLDRYGAAPYTSDNLVLWDDLANGYVADPAGPYILPQYVRPNLQSVIPVGTEGQLLNPLESVVGAYDPTAFQKSWQVGDGGPVENAWWTSSSYPYAVMRLLALTRPAEFFALFADRDDYRYNAELGQYLYNGRYRLDANGVPVYGSVVNGAPISRASYIDWIVDYNQQLGQQSSAALTTALQNLDVRLCYRMAAFSDQQYLEIYSDRSSPNSNNSSLQIPPESYSLVLYKNQPFADIVYSALIVERVVDGYAIYGYSTIQPYFQIFASASNGLQQTIAAGGTSVRVPAQYTNNVVQIPYGYTFANTTVVVDFILSYGRYLESQGLIFDDQQNGYTLNWKQMAEEFLYFSQQGWAEGTMINLNPGATKLKAYRPGAIVDTIISLTPENMLLDQNRAALDTRDLIVERYDNEFQITSTTGQTISFLQLKFTNYEHMVVLDNKSIFNDLLYDPITAARQSRVKIVAATTTEWTGELNAQGFIYNDPRTVEQWKPYVKYTKGEIVYYKNQYWQAATIVQPKATFDFNDWYTSNYERVQTGLLPNIANKADQLANSYNINAANLERDNDLLSYGLIGFKPRQYMVDLNLDDVTQVNLYQQFLGTKGTRLAAEVFTRADLGKETGAYKIYENWAVLAGTYGANANKSFYELQLNEANLQADPATIQVIQPGQESIADQAVFLKNVWRSSYNLTSTDILPTTYVTQTDTALPSAGYVSLDDVDITVFSLDDPSNIAAQIDNVGIGTTIWVAKVNSYDWNIYRCSADTARIFQVQDNLNSTSIVYFVNPHNLAVGDLIIIRYFGIVDGVYRVLSVPSVTSITIAFSFLNTNQTTITGTGIAFFLETMRVRQPSDVADLAYAQSLLPGARVWVDNDGNGHWVVLEKTQPFKATQELLPLPPVSGSLYSVSVSQAAFHIAAIVGQPGTGSAAGVVHTYRRSDNTSYIDNVALTLNAQDTYGFGYSVDFGYQTWAVAGAPYSNSNAGYVNILYLVPGSNNWNQPQLLVAPDEDFTAIKFGAAVTISQDERWIYVGAPAANKVYAFGRVDVEAQEVDYIADGVTTIYNYIDHLQVDSNYPDQIQVKVDSLVAVYQTDYTLSTSSVVFNTAPVAGQVIRITRRSAAAIDQNTYYSLTADSQTGTGVGASFTVTNTRGVYTASINNVGLGYSVGDQLTFSYLKVCPAGSAANDLVITVDSVGLNGVIDTYSLSGSGITNTSSFALKINLYSISDIYSFSVFVDGVIQRPYIDYSFDSISATLTFINNPAAGTTIIVATGTHFTYVGTVPTPTVDADAQFGFSLTTTTDGRQVLIGAPYDTVDTFTAAGAVYEFDRSVVRYQITDTTQTTYAIPGSFVEPIVVTLNGQFLTNTNQYLNGQFTVSGSNVILSSNVALTVGDFLEIETNELQLVQKIASDNPANYDGFGYSVNMDHVDASLYIGAPFDSHVRPQAGTVYRSVNQSRAYGIITSTVANPTLDNGDTIRINDTEVAVPNAPNQNIFGLIDAINAAAIPNVIATATPDLTFIGDGITQIFYIGDLYSAASSYTTVVYVDDVLQTEGIEYTYNSTTKQIIFVTAPDAKTTVVVVSGRMTLSVKNIATATPYRALTVLPGVIGTTFEDLGFTSFVFVQEIQSPSPTDYAYFGHSVNIDTDAVSLVVGAPNGVAVEPVIFDGGKTFFDEYSTTFISPIPNSGVVYTYNYLPSVNASISNPGKFVFGQQIYVNTEATGDQFGTSVNYTGGRLIVGAPGGEDTTDPLANYGYVSVFDNPTNAPVWQVIHAQAPSVDVNLLNGVYSYDRTISKTTTYFDFINPLQGKILGAARRNIDYIGAVDPAQYNVGPIHNNGNSWAGERLGQIWWDTDTVRFIDPNQDNIVYASRRWGQIFPGSRVDIYQWTASPTPPANYTGVGTPLSTLTYTVNTALNSQNILETTYYFWVRGITTIDTGAGKTLSPTGIASYIESPKTSGIPYIAPLDASTVAIYNAKSLISAQDTILHIGFDRQAEGGDNNIHQEFQFVADGIADSFLNATLYRKLQDSFCGVDESGAPVPDPNLSPAERYGVQFRPRQSMFADRFVALENYLTRANTILAQYPISEIRSFNLLNSSEPIPSESSGEWNAVVPTYEVLTYQNLAFVPYGYKYLVLNDVNQQGRWTIYEVTAGTISGSKQLTLYRIQNYDTKLYWSYIDWYLPGYNKNIQPVASVANYASLGQLSFKEVPVGRSVKVNANAQGKWEIYVRSATGWDRVGLQDGTIAISEEIWNYTLGNFGFDVEVFDGQYFDQEPVIETRKIIQAINEELFVDELAIERNQSLVLMFNFIYSEFTTPDWLVKTSLVDVDHNIRALLPYQMYMQDNQTFVLDYIQEVKPYHVQIREFNLIYNGQDTYGGNLTDFDVPAYWNTELNVPQYVSPILLPYTHASTATQNDNSDTTSNAEIWTLDPWKQWFNNYLLSVSSVTVIDGGSGYLVAPNVTITGDCTVPAVLTATINSAGQVVAINVVNPGEGYLVTPTITIDTSGQGATATAVAIMNNDLVRSIKTVIKYDRCEYTTTITDWSPLVSSYAAGTLIRYADQVWSANATITNDPVSVLATGTADTYVLTTASTAGLSTGMIAVGGTVPVQAEIVSLTNTTITLNKVLLSNVSEVVDFYDPFITANWTLVDANSLSGADRTMGYYLPTANEPGLELPLLISGISYPGVQVMGPSFSQNTGFDVGNFDINPFDNISIDANGLPTYDYGILDTFYASYYGTPSTGPIPTGTAITDINVAGGAYVDTYSSHAPEELIPGAEFDTLDMRIYTTPGSDWSGTGHGFPTATRRYVYNPLDPYLDFSGMLPYTFTVSLFNVTTGVVIDPAIYDPAAFYWPTYTIDLTSIAGSGAVQPGDILETLATGIGGGNQLYLNTYLGSELTDGNSTIVPFNIDAISEFAIWNGELQLFNGIDYTYEPVYAETGPSTVYLSDLGTELTVSSTIGIQTGAKVVGTGFTSGQTVVSVDSLTKLTLSAVPDTTPNGVLTFLPITNATKVLFTATYDDTSRINLCALGYAVVGETHSWSAPVFQVFFADGNLTYDLASYASLQGTNIPNVIVERNGIRARPYESSRYVSDGATLVYNLPWSGNYSQGLVVDNDVAVYVDQTQLVLGVDYFVDPYTTSPRTVTLATAPTAGQIILISVRTVAQYFIQGNTITFRPDQGLNPQVGDDITIITWNDPTEQGIYTQVFVGPTTEGITVSEGYDETGYDEGDVTGAPGSFSYQTGSVVQTNRFDLGRTVDPQRLLVTVDGRFVANGDGYTIDGNYLVLTGPIINPTTTLVVTSFTNTVVNPGMSFRIFQDMRGLQDIYRITSETTTTLASDLSSTDDVVYVVDASRLGEPKVEANIWGVITIDGERIMYRERDLVNNTVSSLLRGTAGTAAADHSADALVYDMGIGNLLSAEYQNYVVSNIDTDTRQFPLGDGSTTVFTAPAINLGIAEDSTPLYEAVEVFVGGTRLLSGFTVTAEDPVVVTFDTAPASGSAVAILVHRGVNWYNPGVGTPSDGVPLQDTDNKIARFLRGGN